MSKDLSITFKDMDNLSKTFRDARTAQNLVNRSVFINSATFLASYFRLGTEVFHNLIENDFDDDSKSLPDMFNLKNGLNLSGKAVKDRYVSSLTSKLVVLGSYIFSYDPSLRIADLSEKGKLSFINVTLEKKSTTATESDIKKFKSTFLQNDISKKGRDSSDLSCFKVLCILDDSDESHSIYEHFTMANSLLGFDISFIKEDDFDKVGVAGFEDTFILFPSDINKFLSKQSLVPIEINYDCNGMEDILVINEEHFKDEKGFVYLDKPANTLGNGVRSILDGDYFMLSEDFFELFQKSVQKSISLVGVSVDSDNNKSTFTTLDIIAFCISSIFDLVFDHNYEDDGILNLTEIFEQHFIDLKKYKGIIHESVIDYIDGGGESFDDESGADGFSGYGRESKGSLMYSVDDMVSEGRKSGRFNGCMFRDSEIEEIINGVEKYNRNNVVIVGDSGVGLTTLVYGLSEAINNGKSSKLKDRKVFLVNYQEVISGTRFRGEFEERISNIKKNALANNAIVVIEDIGVGDSDSGNLETIKSQLSKEVSLLILASNKDYVKHQRFFKSFTRVNVEPLSIEQTVSLLLENKSNYEDFHNVSFSKNLISQIVDLSDRYISDQKLPQKSINLLDLVGAKLSDVDSEDRIVADVGTVVDVLARLSKIDKSGIHITESFEDSNLDLSVSKQIIGNLDKKLRSTIFGQDKAIDSVVSSVLVARSGLGDDTKPMASLLFVGPTGVGKTELVKVMSKELSMNLIRLDMSEFMDKTSVNKLIGSSAGYVGYGEGGLLTNQVFNNPNSIILLDEVEKSHQDVLNIFLQILDNGYATDGSGNEINFRNCIIIMTSNSGVKRTVDEKNTISFAGMSSSTDISDSGIDMEQVEKTFSPEFRNRIDMIVEFNYITETSINSIIEKSLESLHEKIKPYGVTVDIGSDVIDLIREKGYNRELGARPLYRYVKDNVIKSVAMLLIGEAVKKGDVVRAYTDGDKIISEIVKKKPKRPAVKVNSIKDKVLVDN